MAKKRPKQAKGKRVEKQPSVDTSIPTEDYFSNLGLDQFPTTYQAALSFVEERFAHLDDHQKGDAVNSLRQETISRIEAATRTPLICYTSKIHNPPKGSQTSINEFDLVGFSDLISTVSPPNVDVFVMSNGGEVEATERIVALLRDRFSYIRFIVPSNAFSAATLLCFCGNEILIGPLGTLGPIDPQMNGTPVQAVLQAFKKAEQKIEKGGMRSLLVYWPLLSKYELPMLEVGEQYCNLSKQLAKKWLSSYMLNCEEDDERVVECANFFSDYETHKSHGRGISRKEAMSKHLNVRELEQTGFYDLVKSLHIQYVFMFDKSLFVKYFENVHGIHWGWQVQPPQEKK